MKGENDKEWAILCTFYILKYFILTYEDDKDVTKIPNRTQALAI